MTIVLNAIERVLAALAALMLAAFTVVILVDIVCRYWLHLPLTWPAELTILLFQWMCFLGAVLALRNGMHFGFDFVLTKLPHKVRAAAGVFSLAVIAVSLGVVIFASLPMIERTRYSHYPTLPFSHAAVYVGVLLSAVLMLVFTAELAMKRVRRSEPEQP